MATIPHQTKEESRKTVHTLKKPIELITSLFLKSVKNKTFCFFNITFVCLFLTYFIPLYYLTVNMLNYMTKNYKIYDSSYDYKVRIPNSKTLIRTLLTLCT